MTRKQDSESDYEIVGAGGGAKPGGIVSVRLKPDEMALLVALSEVGGRTLSETLRLGLRCLGEMPAQVTKPQPSSLRLETRGTQAITEFSTQHEEWSQPSATSLVWTK